MRPETVTASSGASTGRHVLNDGIANAVRFAVTVGSTLAVTPIVIRNLPSAQFSTWTLVVSISTYVAFAEVGTQSAVTRFVARDLADGGRDTPAVVASAMTVVIAAGSVVVGLLALIVLETPWLFSDVPHALLGTARSSVMLLAAGVATGLVGTAVQGYFFAIHRAIVPAMVTVLSRGGAAVGVAIAAITTRSVLALAAVTAISHTAGTALILVLARRALGRPIIRRRLVTRALTRQIMSHSTTLIAWSLAMIAITGLDIVIVGAFDFGSVGAYGLAAQGVSLMLGLFAAAVAPLTAAAARRHAQGGDVGDLLIRYSRVAVSFLVVTSSLLFVAAPTLVRVYAGDEYAPSAASLLRILLVGNVIRSTGGPLGAVLVGTGEHRRIILSPVAEAITNLTVSVILVQYVGARGVAWGTVVGAVVAIGVHLVVTMRRTTFGVSGATMLRHVVSVHCSAECQRSCCRFLSGVAPTTRSSRLCVQQLLAA